MTGMLLIGIDGASWDLLDNGIAMGHMPALKKLKQNGTFGVLKSTSPPVTPAAWASFHTGTDPGDHGVTDFVIWDNKTKTPDLVSSQTLPRTFWQDLSDEGKKIGLVNVPLTYPPPPVNGVVISGILAPHKDSQWSHPTHLKQEIYASFPDYQPVTLDIPSAKETWENPKTFIQGINDAIKQRFELSEWLLTNHSFNFFMVQFQVLDWLQHAMWPHLDATHPQHNPKIHRHIYKTAYKLVDSSIQSLWQQWQKTHKKSSLLIASDHGFQRHTNRIMLGNYFYHKGLFDKNAGKKQKVNKFIKSTGVHLKTNNQFELLGKGGWGSVYVNPGNKVKDVKKLITSVCNQLKDPDNGTGVISGIYEKSQLFTKGANYSQVPDILIKPKPGFSISADIDKTKSFFRKIKPGIDFHLGKHHKNGIIAFTSNQKELFTKKLPTSIDQVASFVKANI